MEAQYQARSPVVTSPRNPRVRDVARLYKRRERDRRGLLVAEGVWALRIALDAGVRVHDVYFCRDFFNGDELALLSRARAAGADVTEIGPRALARLSLRDGPDGIVCVVAKPAATLDDLADATTLVCVVQAIEKPGNLGAIIRTASAAGAEAILVCDPLTDAWGPAVVRASLGAILLAPVVVTTSACAIDWLRDRHVAIYAATPQGRRDPWSVDLVRPTAIVIGNEHRGLGDVWMGAADVQLRIPMTGAMNSLNASTAAGVLLFEAVRQRSVQE